MVDVLHVEELGSGRNAYRRTRRGETWLSTSFPVNQEEKEYLEDFNGTRRQFLGVLRPESSLKPRCHLIGVLRKAIKGCEIHQSHFNLVVNTLTTY